MIWDAQKLHLTVLTTAPLSLLLRKRNEMGSLRVVFRRQTFESVKAIRIQLIFDIVLRKHLSVLEHFRIVGLNKILALPVVVLLNAISAFGTRHSTVG